MAKQGELFGPGVAETSGGTFSVSVDASAMLRRCVAGPDLDTLDEEDMPQLLLAGAFRRAPTPTRRPRRS